MSALTRGGLAGTLALVAACSFINEPDRHKLDRDLGLDLADLSDGEAGTNPPLHETLCGDGADEDEDGLTDCVDFDCAGATACCDAGTAVLDEDWSAADLSATWTPLPSSDARWPERDKDGNLVDVIADFAPSDVPRAIRTVECVPTALGLEVAVDFQPRGETGCTPAARCPKYAALVLTAAEDLPPGAGLLDELAVRVHAGGYVEATQAGATIGGTSFAPGDRLRVHVTLTPGISSAGRAVVLGTATVESLGRDDERVLVEGFEVIDQRWLLRTGACAAANGLYVGLEGRGDGVWVGATRAETLRCANPSQLEVPSSGAATWMSDALGFDDAWSDGTLGAPSLASSRSAAGGPARFDLFAEASNDALELELVTRVGYAIGHATAGALDIPWAGSAAPKLGASPPSCAGATCSPTASVREPFALARLADGNVLDRLIVALAREVDGSPNVYALHVVANAPLDPTTPIGDAGTPVLAPSDVPACASLRDPALVPVGPGLGYWLLYTCERGDGPSRIEAVRLGSDLALVRTSPLSRVVLDPTRLGAYAAAGVRGAEPIVATNGGSVLWVWFLARGVGGRTTLALAQGQAASLDGALPALQAYPANPILEPDGVPLGGCAGSCRITHVAATRPVDDDTAVELVVARRVNGASELVHLRQHWRFP